MQKVLKVLIVSGGFLVVLVIIGAFYFYGSYRRTMRVLDESVTDVPLVEAPDLLLVDAQPELPPEMPRKVIRLSDEDLVRLQQKDENLREALAAGKDAEATLDRKEFCAWIATAPSDSGSVAVDAEPRGPTPVSAKRPDGKPIGGLHGKVSLRDPRPGKSGILNLECDLDLDITNCVMTVKIHAVRSLNTQEEVPGLSQAYLERHLKKVYAGEGPEGKKTHLYYLKELHFYRDRVEFRIDRRRYFEHRQAWGYPPEEWYRMPEKLRDAFRERIVIKRQDGKQPRIKEGKLEDF